MGLNPSERADAEANSTMVYWYPKIADQMTPRSVFVAVPWGSGEWMDKGIPKGFADQVAAAAKAFGYPFFLRTDYASGKHGWNETCFVPDRASLGRHIFGVLEENELAGIVGTPYQWLVLREYIPMETIFEAFHGRMPINHEHRYFIRDDQILCDHPYWPKGAFKHEEVGITGSKMPPDWRKRLDKISRCSHDENVATLKRILGRFHGYWSVDFSHAANGAWYLIDMARGEISFHMPSCPNSTDEMREHYGGLEE